MEAVADQPNSSSILTPRALILCFGAATLVIHLLTNGGYGYFRDELYYIACSQHLAWGYVDQPPLSILLLRLSRILLGDSLHAIRFLPAIASAATVLLTGLIARQLGGRIWAILLSCTAALTAPVYIINGNFFSMNALEPVLWMSCVYLLIRIINGGPPILWLWLGLLAGLGVQNKHSTVFFGAAVAAALLLSPERRHFREKWIWLGGFIAFLVALPNIIWQVQNHWATWELLSNVAHSTKNVVLSPAQFLIQQVLLVNPGTLPLWVGGIIWLIGSRNGGRYRVLAITYLITLVEFILLHGKVYYLAPAYPMLFAAGGVAVEQFLTAKSIVLKPALVALIIVPAVILGPIVAPILPPERLVDYMNAIHFHPPRTETSHTAALPQYFADEFGWEEMVASVAHAYNQLAPEDKKRAAIFCQNYGQAGAIDFFGPKYGLPSAISGHQNYFLWGPRDYPGDVLLILDNHADDEREQFAKVDELGPVQSSAWAMPSEQRQKMYLCRGLKTDLRAFWPRVRKWL